LKEIQRRKEEEERKRQEELAKQAAQAEAEAAEKAAYVKNYLYTFYWKFVVYKQILHLAISLNFTGRKKHQKQMENKLKMEKVVLVR